MAENVAFAKVEDVKVEKKDCGEKYCIKKGEKNELIREINIRLAGFGGNEPTDVFTDRTEEMVKQFQRDYMKVPETGKVCGNVLKSIDDFCSKWSEKIIHYKCLCHTSDSKVKVENRCPGFGKGKTNEHPGMHRTLLWGVSALRFYMSQQKKYSILRISAGYRCWAHNNSIPRTSTNHMGKAGDIIGTNGTSGYGSTKDPHLHFEIRNSASAGGTSNRCHPGIFVHYKGENDMSEEEKKFHKDTASKYWD